MSKPNIYISQSEAGVLHTILDSALDRIRRDDWRKKVIDLKNRVGSLLVNDMPVPANQHFLWKTGDKGCPEAICDRNGEVVLGACMKCGLAEVELDDQPLCDERHVRWQPMDTAPRDHMPVFVCRTDGSSQRVTASGRVYAVGGFTGWWRPGITQSVSEPLPPPVNTALTLQDRVLSALAKDYIKHAAYDMTDEEVTEKVNAHVNELSLIEFLQLISLHLEDE